MSKKPLTTVPDKGETPSAEKLMEFLIGDVSLFSESDKKRLCDNAHSYNVFFYEENNLVDPLVVYASRENSLEVEPKYITPNKVLRQQVNNVSKQLEESLGALQELIKEAKNSDDLSYAYFIALYKRIVEACSTLGSQSTFIHRTIDKLQDNV